MQIAIASRNTVDSCFFSLACWRLSLRLTARQCVARSTVKTELLTGHCRLKLPKRFSVQAACCSGTPTGRFIRTAITCTHCITDAAACAHTVFTLYIHTYSSSFRRVRVRNTFVIKHVSYVHTYNARSRKHTHTL